MMVHRITKAASLVRVMASSFLILVLAVLPLFGQSFKTETGHVEFKSEVPLHSFTGTSRHLVGKINLNTSVVDFYVDLTTIETGIGKRDKDMRKTLETDSYPFAEFYGELVSDFDMQSRQPQPAIARGTFTIHGVSKEIEVKGTLQLTEEGLRLESSWVINIEDYDIKPPGILFYRVDEEQDISIKALLTPIDE